MPIVRRNVTVNGLRDPATGELASGTINLIMPSGLFDEDGNEVWRRDTIPIDLDGGAGSAEVPPNDTAGVTPAGWEFGVEIEAGDWRTTGAIVVPSGVSDLEFVSAFVASSAPADAGTTYVSTVALAAEVAALEAADTAHAADTTNIHGIVDTAALLTAASAADAAARIPRTAAAGRAVEWRTAAQTLADIDAASTASVALKLDADLLVVLEDADPIPLGTPAGAVIVRYTPA